MSPAPSFDRADLHLDEGHGANFGDVSWATFVAPVVAGLAGDESLERGAAESDGGDDDGAFPADLCDLTGVCDPDKPPSKADRKLDPIRSEARTRQVDGGQLYNYGASKDSVLKDDSIKT
jgi:hypothetical protein